MYDCIITNPPYSLKNEFLRRAYEIGKPFAFLLPLTTLETRKRFEMFKRYGISVIIIPERVDFTGKGNPWFAVSWFVKLPTIKPNRLVFI